jgi:general secretion pathway protein D
MSVARHVLKSLTGLLTASAILGILAAQSAIEVKADPVPVSGSVAADDQTNLADLPFETSAETKSAGVQDADRARIEQEKVRAEQEFAETVEQYNDLLRQKRFDDAIKIAEKARLLQPENPVGRLMVLKAKQQVYARQVERTESKLAKALTQESSPEELRIFKKLQKRVWLSFEKSPLSEVAMQVAARSEMNIVLDPIGLEDERVTTKAEITATANGMRLSTFLEQVLAPLHLDFLVENDVLKITSRTRARGELITKNYSVADLLSTEVENGQALFDANGLDVLAGKISASVSPETWDELSGPGSIMPYRTTLSLVIRQTADVHEGIVELLTRLRQEREAATKNTEAAKLEERVKKLDAELREARSALQAIQASKERP